MNFEAPLTPLVWLTSLVSVALTFVVSYVLIPDIRRRPVAVVEAFDGYYVRDACGRDHSGTR